MRCSEQMARLDRIRIAHCSGDGTDAARPKRRSDFVQFRARRLGTLIVTPSASPQKEQRLPRALWLLVALLWLPFPCLFVPFTFMREDYHPWYIGYTSPLYLIAAFFYQPASFVTFGPLILAGHSPSISLYRVAAFFQSALLSVLAWHTYASRLASFPQQMWNRLFAAILGLAAAACILFGILLLLSPSQGQSAISYLCGVSFVFIGARAGYSAVTRLRHDGSEANVP